MKYHRILGSAITSEEFAAPFNIDIITPVAYASKTGHLVSMYCVTWTNSPPTSPKPNTTLKSFVSVNSSFSTNSET